jgi:hypothetical protein
VSIIVTIMQYGKSRVKLDSYPALAGFFPTNGTQNETGGAGDEFKARKLSSLYLTQL